MTHVLWVTLNIAASSKPSPSENCLTYVSKPPERWQIGKRSQTMKLLKSFFFIIHGVCISSQFFLLDTSHPCLEHPVPAGKVRWELRKKCGQWSSYLHMETSALHSILIVKHQLNGEGLWIVGRASPDTGKHYEAIHDWHREFLFNSIPPRLPLCPSVMTEF